MLVSQPFKSILPQRISQINKKYKITIDKQQLRCYYTYNKLVNDFSETNKEVKTMPEKVLSSLMKMTAAIRAEAVAEYAENIHKKEGNHEIENDAE